MERTGRTISTLYIIAMLLVLYAKCAWPFSLVSGTAAALGCALIALALVFMLKKRDRLIAGADRFTERFKNISREKMLSVLFISAFALRILLIILLHSDCSVHVDIDIYLKNAEELRTLGYVVTNGAHTANYPHLFWFALLLSPVSGIGDGVFAPCVLMALLDSLSLVLLADTAMLRFPKEKVFAASLLPAFIPGEVLASCFITHEHALLFLLAVSFRLYFGGREKSGMKRLLMSACSFIFLAASTLLNASGFVAVIAFIMMFISDALSERSLRPLSLTVLLAAVLMICSSVSSAVERNMIEVPDGYVPRSRIIWTLYVGADEASSGRWIAEDENAFSIYPFSYVTEETASAYHRTLLTDRYRELLTEPSRLVKLVSDKLKTTWGSFWYALNFLNETITDESIRVFYTSYLFRPLTLIEYGGSLAGVLWCIMKLTGSAGKQKYDPLRLVSMLCVMGTEAMFILTECTSKYTMAALPFMWLISAAMSGKERERSER